MTTKLVELRPDRDLLDSHFNGYKLSLEKIPVYEKTLSTGIEKVLPCSDHYSLLHARLFGLHNNLFNDHFNTESNVYYIDEHWNVNKAIISEITGRLSEIRTVWQIPECNHDVIGRYNLSLQFTSRNGAVLSNGTGRLFIVETGDRNVHETWHLVFSDKVLDPNQNFMITDAVCLNDKEIHCLLNSVERNDDKFFTVMNWMTFKQKENNTWESVARKTLKGNKQVHYCVLEHSCQYIDIASDAPFKFVYDSENPIVEKAETVEKLKIYSWMQTSDDIVLRFNIKDVEKTVNIDCTSTHINVKYNEKVLLDGDLFNRVDSDSMEQKIIDGILEVTLSKIEKGLIWTEFVKGDDSGEQILDITVVTEVHQRLAHLCSETEVKTLETGVAYNSEQLEECDFTNEDTALFERICGTTHNVTHRINLGTLPYITSMKLSPNSPAAIVLRHDVDACIWQPMEENGEWKMKHEGTLHAFGYVQASKQQRKFSTFSGCLSYSVICDSSRYTFIYRQSKAVSSGELRNRRNGHHVGHVAEQQVLNIGDCEIFGVVAGENHLYLLSDKTLFVFNMK